MLTNEQNKFLDDVFLTLKNYIQQSAKEEFLARPKSPEEVSKLVPDLNSKALSHENLKTEIEAILKGSVSTIHPLFLNQLFGGFDPAAWVGDIVTNLLNPTMATFEIAPMLTVIEKKLVTELIKTLGLNKGEGIMVTGGSNANLLAMLCARTFYSPNIRLTGFGHNRYRIYISEEAHYSFDKAANITGIGTQNLILVPANAKGEMIPEELERIIATDLKDGFTPIMVGATFGTTVLGAFDPLKKIAKICSKYKVWLHVDAAWGGGAAFTKSHRQLVEGIELADSVTFDAHKTMGTSLITSFFLTKHTGILRNANRGGGSEYLFHEYENSEWDTGTYSLQCGRRADALKMWLLWRLYGTEGLIQRTEHLFKLAELARLEVERHPRLKLYHANYLNLCFQVKPHHNQENINSFTLKVRKALVKEGKAMVNYAERADGTVFFRLVFPNHQTQMEHINQLLKMIVEKAEQIEMLGEG